MFDGLKTDICGTVTEVTYASSVNVGWNEAVTVGVFVVYVLFLR